jgi:hypothetical protein
MPKPPVAGRVEEQLRSMFPDGAVTHVQLLEYGDDPAVEPGDTALRVFISRSGKPAGEDADEEIVSSFEQANHEQLRKLRERLPRFVAWAEFQSDRADGAPEPHGPVLRIGRGGRGRPADEDTGALTSVMTRLGPADLATVDTLITAGVANSRAEVLRWAVGRIRENPVYAQVQDRVRELGELKAQF